MQEAMFLRILQRSQGVCKSVKLPWKTVRKSVKTCSELASYKWHTGPHVNGILVSLQMAGFSYRFKLEEERIMPAG